MNMSASDFDSPPRWHANGPVGSRRGGLWFAAVGAAVAYLLAFPSARVVAQTAPAAASTEAAPELQEVVVTGSRIPVPANISATSPTTIVSSQRSEEHTSE